MHDDDKSILWKGGIGALVLIGLTTLWLGIYTVDQGEIAIIKRNGAVIGTEEPGLHVKIPWIDSAPAMEIRERAAHLELSTSSSDPMILKVSATVNWVVNKAKVVDLYNEYGSLEQFEQRVITPAFNDAVKTATSRFTVNDLIKSRDKLGVEGLAILKSRVPQDVITITGLYIVDVDFPDAYEKQILDKQVAAEAALTEKNSLLQQQYKSQQATQTAAAEAEGVKLKAAAEAEAIEKRGAALAKFPMLIEYERVRKWEGKFPETFMGGDAGAATMWSLSGKTTPKAVTP